MTNFFQKLSQEVPDEVQKDCSTAPEKSTTDPTSCSQSITNVVTQLNSENLETFLGIFPDQTNGSSVDIKPCPANSLTCVFAEIELTDKGKKSMRQDAEFAEKSLQFLQQLLCPSVLAYSDEKYQAYWFLEEPWIFSDEEDQEAAKAYIERFQSAIAKCLEIASVDDFFICTPTIIPCISESLNCQNPASLSQLTIKYPSTDDFKATNIHRFSRKRINTYINYLLADQPGKTALPSFECDVARFLLNEDNLLRVYQAALTFPAVLPNGCFITAENKITFQTVKHEVIVTIEMPLFGISRQFCNPHGKLLDVVTFLSVDGHWKEVICNPSMLATPAGIKKLVDYGLHIKKEILPDVVNFINKFKLANIGTLPIIKTTTKMGWQADNSFFPGNSELMFMEEGSNCETNNQFLPQGDLATWVDIMKKAKENTGVRLAMAASFGAPLLHLFKVRTYFIHLYGPSTGGKSAAQSASSSIWMTPEEALKTFNATGNSLDFHLDKMNHLPIFLSELQIIKDNQKFIEQLIYKICEGQGKLRGKSNGGLQDKTSWNSITITSGEHPLTSMLSNQGIFTRVMEFYFSPVISDKNLAQELHRISNQHYGLAGQMFIRMIKSMKMEILKSCFSTFQHHISAMIPAESRKVHSYSNYLTVLAVADYYSSQEVFGDQEDLAFLSTLHFIKLLIDKLVCSEPEDELHRAKAFIEDWLFQRQSHFGIINRTIPNTPPTSECYGYKFPDQRIAVIPTILQNVLRSAGLDWDSLKHGFAENDWIYAGNDRGSKTYTKKYSSISELGNVRFIELIGFGSNANNPTVNHSNQSAAYLI